MSTAFRFVEGNGNLKYQRLAQLGVSKIYELAMEDDEVLKGLEDGETVAGMTVEKIDLMSVRELKQKLRDAKKDKEALEKLIESKNTKIDEQEKLLVVGDQQGRPVTDWSDKARSLVDEVNGLLIQASRFCARINAMADEVLALPSHGYSNEASVVFLTLRNAAAILYEEAEATGARLDCLEPEAPEHLASTGLAGLGIEVRGDV